MSTRTESTGFEGMPISAVGGDYTLDRVECDVGEIIENVLKKHDAERLKKHITFDAFSNLQGRVRLRADERLIRIALSVLVDNAISNSPEDCAIEILMIKNRKCASIIVIDHGAGMQLERQREMFNGVDTEFAVARRIAELHGGSINVLSLPGHGARFIFRLPLNEAEKDDSVMIWES